MASDGAHHDALTLLQQGFQSNSPFNPGTSDPSSAFADFSLAQATHLHFTNPAVSLPLDTITRFHSNEAPVDLRSIYFAYRHKDDTIPAYSAATSELNAQLAAAGVDATVQQLAFVERMDLASFVEGSDDYESEYIKTGQAPSASQAAAAASGAQVARSKQVDPRLAEIYAGERKTGDRNSVLRGVKPTDFSNVRKIAQTFTNRKGTDPKAANARALPVNTKPSRRPDPIILVSPSASALLRMGNIKEFLEGGTFAPASDSLNSSGTNILHLSRLIPYIDPNRATRFIVVDGPEQFKPEYWARVVAVFTTGQVWQFKNYKWSDPAELFRHTLGVYLGIRGEPVPAAVKGWGRGILPLQIEDWRASEGRWRDREVVEQIWRAIEEGMRAKGWTKERGPAEA